MNEHHYSNNLFFSSQNVSIWLLVFAQSNLRKEMLQADEQFLKLWS